MLMITPARENKDAKKVTTQNINYMNITETTNVS